MFYKVLYPFTFEGVAYKVGNVIDLGDPESATKLLREAGSYAVELTTVEEPPVPEVKAVEEVEAAKEPAKAEPKAVKPAKAAKVKAESPWLTDAD